MAWPLIRIVDSLDRGRVLFDFNPGRNSEQQRWVGAGEFDFGTPEWEPSIVGMVEGARVLSIPVHAQGLGAEAALGQLAEILTRTAPTYLQFQTRQDSAPLWFRLHRQASANPLDFSTVWWDDADRSTWRWKVDLAADAFALGARETLTPTTELAQAGEAIMSPVEIPDQIKGTAPAPLNLEIDGGDLSGYTTQLMSWAMDPAMTVSPWSGTANLDLTFSGTDYSLTDMGTLPVTPPPGQYRCLLFVTRTTTGSAAAQVRVGINGPWGAANNPFTPWRVMAPSSGNQAGRWFDCGRLNLPAGVSFEDLAEDELPDLDFALNFNGDNNPATWKITNFTLIPVQTVMSRAATTVLTTQWNWMGTEGVLRLDGERARAGLIDRTSRKWSLTKAPIVDGSYPRVHPGARNFLMFLPRMNPVPGNSPGTSGETKMWYYPRYLHVGSR